MNQYSRIWINGKLTHFAINGVPQPLAGEERADWPLPLVPLKLLAKPGDRGAGDIIARVIGPIGGDAFKIWHKRLFGKACGCTARQENLNERWPL